MSIISRNTSKLWNIYVIKYYIDENKLDNACTINMDCDHKHKIKRKKSEKKI